MRRRDLLTGAFLVLTALTVGWELVAALDNNPDTRPWTDLISSYVPEPVTRAAIAALCTWLPVHFTLAYLQKRRGMMPETQPTTQTSHPWRATLRTIVAMIPPLLIVLPEAADRLGITAVPWVAGVLAVAAGITRVLAMPAVDGYVRKFLPWLAPSPQR